MRLNYLKRAVLILFAVAIWAPVVASASDNDTLKEGHFSKIVSFINKVLTPPDYVKGGEWRVDYLKEWHAAPPPPVVVSPAGDVYIASEGHVQYFSNAGSYQGEWELPDSPFRFGFFGLAIGPDGMVFSADHSAGRVYEFSPQGRLLSEWEAQVGPLAVSPNGDIYASTGRRIQRYDVKGNLLGEWGSYGTGDGEFRVPLDLAVGPDGTVYVLDSEFGGVQYFTAEGSFLGRWGTEGRKYGRYTRPSAIAVGPDGKVFVCEDTAVRTNSRFDYFTSTGSFLGTFDLPEWRGTDYGPGMAVAPDGTVYISDRNNGRICYYKPSRIYYVIRYAVIGVLTVVGFSVFAFLIRFSLLKLKRRAAC